MCFQKKKIALRCRDFVLAYDDQALFSGLIFELEAEKITCLLGPSGMGKSSLLRAVAGLMKPLSGQLTDNEGGSFIGPGCLAAGSSCALDDSF